ncbi:MAG TPA: OmpA family protein [Candidatus Sulfotelmatobacter sp.]|nr:OmpA family protein [Candidatus Sulfotelmatobacter sp.]
MQKTVLSAVILLAASFGLSGANLQAQDNPSCKDSPLVTRFPGSTLDACEDKPDSEYTFEEVGPQHEPKKLEGEYHYLHYNIPSTASKPQIVRNYRTALQSAGYTKVQDNDDNVFTFQRGKTWIRVSVGAWGDYEFHILKETQVTQDVVATAAELTGGLGATGHVVVNGIFFDTGKSEVKPESATALDQIAKVLQQDPKLKIYVVGHTDNVGALPSNVELSRQRAAAVVKVLTTQYRVSADRLLPYGAGPYMPRASNDSDEGRAQNRRVELVKQ